MGSQQEYVEAGKQIGKNLKILYSQQAVINDHFSGSPEPGFLEFIRRMQSSLDDVAVNAHTFSNILAAGNGEAHEQLGIFYQVVNTYFRTLDGMAHATSMKHHIPLIDQEDNVNVLRRKLQGLREKLK